MWRDIYRRIPGARAARSLLRRLTTGTRFREPVRRGHYYSPLPDLYDVQARAHELFAADTTLDPSVDLCEPEQLKLAV